MPARARPNSRNTFSKNLWLSKLKLEILKRIQDKKWIKKRMKQKLTQFYSHPKSSRWVLARKFPCSSKTYWWSNSSVERSQLGKRRSPLRNLLPFAALLRCQAFWRGTLTFFLLFLLLGKWRSHRRCAVLRKFVVKHVCLASLLYYPIPQNILELSRTLRKSRHLIGSLNNTPGYDWL